MKYLQPNITECESKFLANILYYERFRRLNAKYYFSVDRKLNKKLTTSIYDKLLLRTNHV